MDGRRKQDGVGTVYLVGAGPGDPGLLTLRGRACLEASDWIVYDYLANPTLLEYAPPKAHRICTGKHGTGRLLSQEEINQILIEKAREGKTVTRLKGGDPFLFGRGGEEAEALEAAGIPFEVVPGVSAATAVPAYAGIPLTHRTLSSSVALVTGYEDPAKPESRVAWEHLATGIQTLVVFMGMRQLTRVTHQLRKYGRSPHTPVAVIQWGTLPYQRTVTGTLEEIVERVQEAGLRPPGLVVIGDVVRLRERLNWFEKRPLFGRRVVVTRAREQAGELRRRLEALGASVVEFPTLEVLPPEDWGPLDQALESLSAYSWILFTSVNGVRFFFHRLRALGKDARHLGGLQVCAVGERTARELETFGIRADALPRESRAEGVVALFQEMGLPAGTRILFPRAVEGREVLVVGLQDLGLSVDLIPVYRTGCPVTDPRPLQALLEGRQVDAITLTSPASARNLLTLLGDRSREWLQSVVLACISPVTAQALEDLGYSPQVVASRASMDALCDALVAYWSPGASSPGEEA